MMDLLTSHDQVTVS